MDKERSSSSAFFQMVLKEIFWHSISKFPLSKIISAMHSFTVDGSFGCLTLEDALQGNFAQTFSRQIANK